MNNMDNEFTIKLSDSNYMKELVSILVDSNYPVTVKKITRKWPYDHDYHYEVTITNIEEENKE